ncbi:MAG: hypothetical protein K2I79_04260 [Clostridia bacterium]|nr:hypothetical protein [Clostridia bacterium]
MFLFKKKNKKSKNIQTLRTDDISDVQGSYTGVDAEDMYADPVQDVDDL